MRKGTGAVVDVLLLLCILSCFTILNIATSTVSNVCWRLTLLFAHPPCRRTLLTY